MIGTYAADAGATPPVRIMPLGDSITQADAGHASYRYLLWKKLKAAGYQVDFVGSLSSNHGGENPEQGFDTDHEGHWGWRVDQILRGMPGRGGLRDFLKLNTPDVVLIHLGSNDIFQGENVRDIVNELKEMIGLIRSVNPEAVLLIARLIPVPDVDIMRKISQLNDSISELPAEFGSPQWLIVVGQDRGYDPVKHSYDGVHPNASGEKEMAGKWFEALRPVLQKRSQ